jgi:hypothetical protein
MQFTVFQNCHINLVKNQTLQVCKPQEELLNLQMHHGGD